jgi:hypothetical protein
MSSRHVAVVTVVARDADLLILKEPYDKDIDASSKCLSCKKARCARGQRARQCAVCAKYWHESCCQSLSALCRDRLGRISESGRAALKHLLPAEWLRVLLEPGSLGWISEMWCTA